MRFPFPISPLLIGLIFQVALVSQATAQPLSVDFQSVEVAAARSELIVRAVITDVTEYDPKNSFGYQSVEFQILETLKGKPSRTLRLAIQYGFGRFALDELKKEKTELLLFLSLWKTTRTVSQSYYYYGQSRFPYAIDGAIVLQSDRPRWKDETSVAPMSNDMKELKTSDRIIGVVKQYLLNRSSKTVDKITSSVRVPNRLNLGGIPGKFEFVLDADSLPAGYETAKETEGFADFAAVKEHFKQVSPPTAKELNPKYDRTSSGYVGIEAVEFMASDCDLIVRAIPLETCFVASAGDAPTTGPINALKLRVIEKLKGAKLMGPDSDEFICLIRDTRAIGKLIETQQEIVLFLRRTDRPDWSGFVRRFDWIARASTWDDFVIVLDDRAEVLFADMTWHGDRKSILGKLRRLGTTTQLNRPMSFYPPASLVKGTSVEGNRYAMLYLAVDSTLESNARNWTRSENPDLRWLGAKSLLHFKSDQNAAILKSLLLDDAIWKFKESYSMLGSPFPNEQPAHLIRWEAWQILTAWGYPCDKPPLGRSERL